MRDIVIIPTYYRPEYLTLCLEHIQAARGDRDLEVRVYHDHKQHDGHIHEDSRGIANAAGACFRWQKAHNAVGNTLNFLEAYREAYADKPRYIYLIEDDVLVGPDFFRWHEAVQERGNYFCSVGWHCIRREDVKTNPVNDPNGYIESGQDFSSIGVCWKRDTLAALVAHAKPAYYMDPSTYLRAAFPNSPIPSTRWVEQAGLIMRLILDMNGKRIVAWAGVPRCAHVGVSGYHRSNGQRYRDAEDLREAIRTGAIHNGPQSFDDINTLGPEQEWSAERLYVSRHF